MPSHKEYLEQIETLKGLADAARRSELKSARTQILQIMEEFGISAVDVLPDVPKKKGVKTPVQPKFRDSASGQTWSGRGRAPKWMLGANKEEFRIEK